MHHRRTLAVQIFQRIQQRVRPPPHIRHWERAIPLRQHRPQVVAWDILHRQEEFAPILKVIQDTRQTRVAQRRQQPTLSAEGAA